MIITWALKWLKAFNNSTGWKIENELIDEASSFDPTKNKKHNLILNSFFKATIQLKNNTLCKLISYP